MGRLLGGHLRNSKPFAEVPIVPQSDWVKAQDMNKQGYMNLSFKMADSVVVPSKQLISSIPKNLTTFGEKKTYIKTWAREFSGMCKNPAGYKKLVDGTWDFDTAMDMAFSFWMVTPLDVAHPKRDMLHNNGIFYTCTCPRFQHYFTCKHVLFVAMHEKQVEVPTKFNTEFVGKRKAPAGASLSKRGKCLSIDN